MIEVTPADLAQYDQAFAESEGILRQLIESYRTVRAADQADGIPLPVTIVALAQHIVQYWPADAVSSALAAAVVLMDRHESAP